jgi:hypothetical protein
VALAPSEGRAEGALLTVILARFKTGAPGGWQPFAGRAGAAPLRYSAGAVGGWSLVRADAAVALLGLRRQEAPGVRGFPGLRRPAARQEELRQAGVSVAVRGAGLTCADGRARRALRALEDVRKVLTGRNQVLPVRICVLS